MNLVETSENQGTVSIPDKLIFDKSLSSNEFRTLLVLIKMGKEAMNYGEEHITPKGNILLDVTRMELALAVNVSLPTIYACLKSLEKLGYIRIKPQSSTKNGNKFGNSPVYLISEKFN